MGHMLLHAHGTQQGRVKWNFASSLIDFGFLLDGSKDMTFACSYSS